MNISQHAVVPLTSFVNGYYNSRAHLVESTIITSSLLTPSFGCNSFLLSHIPITAGCATFKSFDPYYFTIDSFGFILIPVSSSFSVQIPPDSLPFVRVVAFYARISNSLVLSRQTLNFRDLL